MAAGRTILPHVNRNHPCRICGKRDWCRYTEDGAAHCYRVDNGLGKLKQDSAGYDYWLYGGRVSTGPSPEIPSRPEVPCADVETRDLVYRAWLEEFHLEARHREALEERGLQAPQIRTAGYRSMPLQGRSKVAKSLLERHGPETCALIPGLYQHEDGYPTLAGSPGILIPLRDELQRIVALSIRADDPGDGPKYLYVSSRSHNGPGPGSVVHVPLFNGDTSRVRLTEGALKSDVSTALSGLLSLGLSGVSGWRAALDVLKRLQAQTVVLAFDADAVRNYNVARGLSNTAQALAGEGFAVEMELWDEADGKGIDDLLRAGKAPQLITGAAVGFTIAGIVAQARDFFRAEAAEAGDPLADARDQIAFALGRLKEDRGAAFTPEALEAFAQARAHDPGEWARIKGALQKARVSIKEVQAAMPYVGSAGDREAQDADDGPEIRTAGEMLEDVPAPQLIIPQPYTLAPNGTGFAFTDDDGQPHMKMIAYSPVIITGRLYEVDEGTEYLRLSWKRPQGWRDKTVDRGTAFNGRKLIELASHGFPVADTNTKDLVDYLHKLEAVNLLQFPSARISSHLGWQGPDAKLGYLWGRTLLSPDGEEAAPVNLDELPPDDWKQDWIAFRGTSGGDEQIASGYHAAGSAADYFQALTVLDAYPRALLGFYASLVPPLLQILGAPNFILEWANRTSTGKTICLRIAASVWGKPDERAADGAMWSWDATRVGAERLCGILSGLPVILDDTKRIGSKNPGFIAEMIYLVVNGRGKIRGKPGGIANTKTWKTILLSSGEVPATSFTQDGGTRPRCLEIRGIPFGKDDQATRQVVDSLNLSLLTHYGHAGPLFVRWLLGQRGQWPRFTEEYQASVNTYAQNATSPIAGRMAHCAAAIDMAAVLAHAALELPWDYRDPLEHIWGGIIAEASEDMGEVRALRDVISWAWAHANWFIGRQDTDNEGSPKIPSQGWAGKWDGGTSWAFIAFYHTRLDAILKERGFEPEGVYPAWKERGWLETEGKYYTRKVSISQMFDTDGSRPRMVVITRAACDFVDA